MGYSPWGRKESNTTEHVRVRTYTHVTEILNEDSILRL